MTQHHQTPVENWGFFDDNAREFVLTTPRPPRPWKNILWNTDYNWQIEQSGTGISYRRDEDGAIILLTWMGNKCYYLLDTETGEYFSIGYWPTNNDGLESFTCRYGLGYQVITQTNLGIEVEMTAIVPLEGCMELCRFKLKNRTHRPRKLMLVPHIDVNINFSDPYHGAINRFVCSQAIGQGYLGVKNICHLAVREYNANMASSHAIESFAFDKQEFIGTYGSIAHPEHLKDTLPNCLDAPSQLAMTARIPVTLGGQGEDTVQFAFGNFREKVDLKASSLALVQPGVFERELAKINTLHAERYSHLSVKTPDEDFNRYVNIWLQHQVAYSARWNRGWGKGFRDGMQDAWAYLLIDPARVREMIADALPHQYEDGRTLRKWAQIDRKAYNDGPVWLALTVAAYVAETADYAFLSEEYGFFESQDRGTVLEHLRRGMKQLFDHRGERGLCLMPYGDWNDQLTGPGAGGKGESVWTTLAFATALPCVAHLADAVHDSELAEYCRSAYAEVASAIQKNAWNGEWFVRATCDDGRKVGLPTDKYGRIWLLPQAWSILAGIATPQQVEKLIAACDKHLLVDFGYLLLTPGWREYDPSIGNISTNPAGFVENGSNYCHASTFMMNALCQAGKVDKALDIFHRLMPTNPKNPPSHSLLEPFSFTNSFFGPEIGAKAGQAMFSWRTGTASWAFRTAVEGILGVQARMEGLYLSRHWPTDWPQAELTRRYRGKSVTIRFRRTGKAALTVNGKSVEGNLIPEAMITDGGRIEVEA